MDLLKTNKHTKVVLDDYDFETDIQNRLLLKKLSADHLAVLEEIVCNSLHFPVTALEEHLDLPDIKSLVLDLLPLNLFQYDGKFITVDKDKRKYFETQLTRFEQGFSPDLEFFQNLLKCLPINVLPNWYHVPRTSNNIFQSLIERYLSTPQIYYRYLSDIIAGDDLLASVAGQILTQLSIPAASIQETYHLSPSEFEKLVLLLEFHMIASSIYEEGTEILTAFREWREYQQFLQTSAPKSQEDVLPLRKQEFAFIQDMADLLELANATQLTVFYLREKELWSPAGPTATLLETHLSTTKAYAEKLINKTLSLGLALIEETSLKPTKAAHEWCAIPVAKRAHLTFKHPHNFLVTQKISPIATQRTVLEIQKSLACIASSGWVFFDDFLEAAQIFIHEDHAVSLKKTGRTWNYALPKYTEEERSFIEYIVCDWLFESGVTQVGTKDKRPVFRLTSLGRSLSV